MDSNIKEEPQEERVEFSNQAGVWGSDKENQPVEIQQGLEEEPIVSTKTWVVVLILSLGYGTSFWPIPVMAAVGSNIAAEFGNAGDAAWFIPAWTLSITVCFMICGANTDLLGRRWFLVGGNVFCFIGEICIASAKNNTAVIAGMALAGFGAANCQMAAFALSELLPNKWRHIGVVLADLSVFIAVTIAPVTGRYGLETNSWGWNFYAGAVSQALSFVGLYLLYFPPAHPYNMDPRKLIKELDYLGMALFTAGAIPVLMGLVYTTIYPSSDPHVVASFAIGFFILILFALWETYGNSKHPLTPTYMFTSSNGRDLTAPCIALGIVNMFYYSSSILWPTMINVFYTDNGADWRDASILSMIQGLAITTGGTLLTVFGRRIRHWHWQMCGTFTVTVLFGVLLALGNPSNKGLMLAFTFLSQMTYSWAVYLAIAISQMGVEHRDLGHSGGISGVARFAAGTIGTTIYTTILSKTVQKKVAEYVPPAATAAGLPVFRINELLSALGKPNLDRVVPTPVAVAATRAWQRAYEKGIQYIFSPPPSKPSLLSVIEAPINLTKIVRNVCYCSLAFGIVGIVACLLCKDIDSKMDNKIEVYMENTEYADRNQDM
ncbi:hypothetical protein B7463_g10045, partial [Scytalidium lignicola]